MSPRESRTKTWLAGFLAGIFLVSATSLPAQEEPRARSKLIRSPLVQVHVRAERRGVLEVLEINGVRIPGYQPTIIHAFPATGVVIDDQGNVLTFVGYRWVDLQSASVRVDVETSQGERHRGQLIGIDQSLGVAVVSSPNSGLKRTPLCDRCEVRGGATILAPVAEPAGKSRLGPAQVVSVQAAPQVVGPGEWIVTINRPLVGVGEPLLDSEHRVLGFVAKQGRSPGDPAAVQTVMYPIAQLLNSASKILQAGGDIRTGWLGVFLDDQAAPSGAGVTIRRVEADSPAQRAGLQPDDVLVRWEGQEVRDVRRFIRTVQDTAIGTKVLLEVLRRGRPARLWAVIEPRRPQGFAERVRAGLPRAMRMSVTGYSGLSGIRITTLTPGLADFLQVPGQTGVLVLAVESESNFGRAGVMAGDVILSADSQIVRDPEDFASYVQSRSAAGKVLLRTFRKGAERDATVEVATPASPGRRP